MTILRCFVYGLKDIENTNAMFNMIISEREAIKYIVKTPGSTDSKLSYQFSGISIEELAFRIALQFTDYKKDKTETSRHESAIKYLNKFALDIKK